MSKKWQNQLVSFILKTYAYFSTLEGTWKILCNFVWYNFVWYNFEIFQFWICGFELNQFRQSLPIGYQAAFVWVQKISIPPPWKGFLFEPTPLLKISNYFSWLGYTYFLETHIPTSLGCSLQALNWLQLWKYRHCMTVIVGHLCFFWGRTHSHTFTDVIMYCLKQHV